MKAYLQGPRKIVSIVCYIYIGLGHNIEDKMSSNQEVQVICKVIIFAIIGRGFLNFGSEYFNNLSIVQNKAIRTIFRIGLTENGKRGA